MADEQKKKPADTDLDDSLAKAETAKPKQPKPSIAPVPPQPSGPPASSSAPAPAPKAPAPAPRPSIGNVAAGLSPKAHKQAAKQVVVEDAFDFDVAFNMAFIGSGQGGGRIANEFYGLGYRRIAVLNSTEMDFKGLHDEIHKHSLDFGGAAKDAKTAATNLTGREEEVWELLTRAWGNDVDYGLVTVSLGGGTGSGTAPLLVDIVRQYMESKGREPRVGAIVSLPTVTEGQQVARNAVNCFKKLLDLKVSPLLIIDNARIHELYKPGMSALHPTANQTVSQMFHLFNQLASIHSEYITFDRSEFAQLLDNGIVVMGAASLDPGSISSPADISKSIREELTNNVLAEVDLKKGQKACCLFVGSQDVLDNFSLDYFEAGFSQLDRTLGKDAIVHRGLYLGDEGLQVYTMLSELEPPLKRLGELAKKAGMNGNGTRSKMAEFFGIDDAV